MLEAAPEGPALENIANNLSPEARRRLRYGRREALWRASELRRVRHCGRVVQDRSAGVRARLSEGVGGFAGLQHCGSVWADPVCASRILVRRALEIGTVLGGAINEGYWLAFGTFTLRHHLGHPLAETWKAAQTGWQAAISGAHWQAAKDLGVEGWVRVWECTHGCNGWHPHVHFVLVLDGNAAAQLDSIVGGMFERWQRAVGRLGYESIRVAQDWHLVQGAQAGHDLGGYLSKLATSVDGEGLGLELTHGLAGRSLAVTATRPTWAILDHLMTTGEASALTMWHEWERGSKGKRQIGWSKGLRERFGPEVDEMSDDEIVAEELGCADDDVLHFEADAWRELVSSPGRPLRVLEVLERAGVGAVCVLLDSWGVKYRLLVG